MRVLIKKILIINRASVSRYKELTKTIMEKKKNNNQKCCLCKRPIEKNGQSVLGHNPSPLMRREGERCCDECNYTYVIQSRMILLTMDEKGRKKCTNKKGWVNNVVGTMWLIDTHYKAA
jgi:hypothetical protein